jgi:hypothetical protein
MTKVLNEREAEATTKWAIEMGTLLQLSSLDVLVLILIEHLEALANLVLSRGHLRGHHGEKPICYHLLRRGGQWALEEEEALVEVDLAVPVLVNLCTRRDEPVSRHNQCKWRKLVPLIIPASSSFVGVWPRDRITVSSS